MPFSIRPYRPNWLHQHLDRICRDDRLTSPSTMKYHYSAPRLIERWCIPLKLDSVLHRI